MTDLTDALKAASNLRSLVLNKTRDGYQAVASFTDWDKWAAVHALDPMDAMTAALTPGYATTPAPRNRKELDAIMPPTPKDGGGVFA
jgi:hypothetical protein